MAIFPVSLLPGEPPSAPPPPKPRQLTLPPRPPAPRDDASDARPPPRPATTTAQPRRQAQASLAHQRTVTRQQAERDARQASAERAQEQAEQATVLPYAGQGGQSGQGGQGGDQQRGRDDDKGGAASASRADTLDLAADELDCNLLAGLLPSGADDGIFEVLLPGGDKLGVAVDVGARSTSLLLMPSSERLRTQIKKKKMELENALERRMETQVRLTVL